MRLVVCLPSDVMNKFMVEAPRANPLTEEFWRLAAVVRLATGVAEEVAIA